MKIGIDDNNTTANAPAQADELAELIKDQTGKEKTAFADLSGKKKVEYIWDYYKWWIIIGVIAIIALTVIIRDYRENSKPTYLHVEMLNTYFGYDRSNTLYDDFAEAAGVDLSKEHLYIGTETTLSTDSFDTTMMAYQQRLIASYAAQEIDVVIGPKKIIEGPANWDCYADFNTIIPKDLMDELEDRDYELYYLDPPADEEDGTDPKAFCAGIYLDNCSYLNNMGESGAYPVAETEDDRPVFTIAANSLRTDHAIKFLRFLIENR